MGVSEVLDWVLTGSLCCSAVPVALTGALLAALLAWGNGIRAAGRRPAAGQGPLPQGPPKGRLGPPPRAP